MGVFGGNKKGIEEMFNFKIVNKEEYRDLVNDYNRTNRDIDILTAERNRLQRKVNTLELTIVGLKEENELLKAKKTRTRKTTKKGE